MNYDGQEATEITERHIITSIYQKFLEIGSVEKHRIRFGRPSIITDDRINEIEEILNRKQQTNGRKIDREMNISMDKVHRIMRDIIRFKSYMMHSTQQLYVDEDMNLHVVEMSERFETHS